MGAHANTAAAAKSSATGSASGTAKASGLWASMFDGSTAMCPPLMQVMFVFALLILWYSHDLILAVALGFLWVSSHLWSIERFMHRQAGMQ